MGFSIEAADPKTGAPEFADTLADDTGIAAANADLSTATVTPDVVVTLPMALDLSAPLTYVNGDGDTVQDCDPSASTAPCPFQQVDASGLGRVISSPPRATASCFASRRATSWSPTPTSPRRYRSTP